VGEDKMAVELQELYEAVKSSYDIQLRTKSCYEKSVEWVHMVEGVEFIKLLHGMNCICAPGITPQDFIRAPSIFRHS